MDWHPDFYNLFHLSIMPHFHIDPQTARLHCPFCHSFCLPALLPPDVLEELIADLKKGCEEYHSASLLPQSRPAEGSEKHPAICSS